MQKTVCPFEDSASWSERHFGNLDLGDIRRNRRVVRIGYQMAEHPGETIPSMTSSEYEMKAAYNLFSHPRATPDTLQKTHREDVMRCASERGKPFLFLQDLSTMSFTGRVKIPGLGPVGHGESGQQGYQMNSVLVAAWDRASHEPEALRRRPPLEVIGLADQQIYARIPRPRDEARNEKKKKRFKRHRESEYWGWATERMRRVPQGCDWVRVVDAEGDAYPFLTECLEFGYSFIVRSGQNRALCGEARRYISDAVGEAQALGQFEIFARAREDKPARMMTLSIARAEVAPRPPYRLGGRGKEEPLRCNAIRVWEENPPPGQEALEWILLTDRKAETFGEAHEISLMYCSRWLIEEFHKALKSGLGLERLQLESGEGLMSAGAIMSVVAIRLVQLKENARLIPEEPAERAGLSDGELRVLRAMIEARAAEIKRPKKNREIVTVRDVLLAVGSLGGHKGRKCDGLPGWQTLWRGITALMRVAEGVALAKKMERKFDQ